jgi:hypothetical protein
MLAEPDVDRAVVAEATRPIAAPLARCGEFLGVDVATVRKAAAHVEPYVRVDGTKVWSLMQLERRVIAVMRRRLAAARMWLPCTRCPDCPGLSAKPRSPRT